MRRRGSGRSWRSARLGSSGGNRFHGPDGASSRCLRHTMKAEGDIASQKPPCIRSRGRGPWIYKDRRIRVNAVSPGSIDTPGLSGLPGSTETGRERLKMIHNSVPLGRLSTPDEIARSRSLRLYDERQGAVSRRSHDCALKPARQERAAAGVMEETTVESNFPAQAIIFWSRSTSFLRRR